MTARRFFAFSTELSFDRLVHLLKIIDLFLFSSKTTEIFLPVESSTTTEETVELFLNIFCII